MKASVGYRFERIHDMTHLKYNVKLEMLFFVIYPRLLLCFRITVKETLIIDLLFIIGAILVLLHGLYGNN